MVYVFTQKSNRTTSDVSQKTEFQSALYLYTNVQVACSLDPVSLTEANVVSSTADYPTINAFLVNSQSPATVHRFLETVMKAIESQPGTPKFCFKYALIRR